MRYSMGCAWRSGIVACLIVPLVASAAYAQAASLRGRVLTDSTEHPIAGVVVSIAELKLQVTSDSLGNFLIPNITPGARIVSTRKIGFGPLTTRVTFGAGQVLEADLLLTPTAAQSLPDVTVETKAPLPARGRLVEFEQRRAEGSGRFLTQADLEKRAFATLTDALRQLPGIEFERDRKSGRGYFAVAGRSSLPACALCNPKSPAMVPCYAAVVLDGAFVYGAGAAGDPTKSGDEGEPKFNLNSIDPSSLAGVEYYVGAASMPVKYNGTRSTCGLLVLWTK